MNIYQIVQSVLVYFCTAGFVTALGYMVTLYRRVIILEQKVEFSDKCYAQTSEQIEKILAGITEIGTRLTKLEVRLEGNSKKNND